MVVTGCLELNIEGRQMSQKIYTVLTCMCSCGERKKSFGGLMSASTILPIGCGISVMLRWTSVVGIKGLQD